MKRPRYLALYGTLRRGEAGHKRLRLAGRLRYVGSCKVRGLLFDLGDYPALMPGEGIVVAELYEIRGMRTLALLDAYEGADPKRPGRGLFVRREISLLQPRLRADVYFFGAAGAASGLPMLEEIASGDWKRRGLAKRRPVDR